MADGWNLAVPRGGAPSKMRLQEVAFPGRGVKHKIILGLVLSAVVPLLVLTYMLNVYALFLREPTGQQGLTTVFVVLIFFTGLLVVAGGFVIWDVARAVTRSAELVTAPVEVHEDVRSDELGTIMTSVSRMVSTIGHQATEINALATQLESAYKELQSANARLELSFKDEVTGLYNRRFFLTRLEEEISRYHRFNHPLTVALLDFDGFKAINDELGHTAGDQILREAAELLLRQSRGINVISRYGGDEFMILLVETTKAGARLYSERIRHVVADYQFRYERSLTVSIGIAGVPEDVVTSSGDLIQAADEALYAAKRSGKDRVALHRPTPDDTPTAA